jgi:hypothetical protein
MIFPKDELRREHWAQTCLKRSQSRWDSGLNLLVAQTVRQAVDPAYHGCVLQTGGMVAEETGGKLMQSDLLREKARIPRSEERG